MKIRVDLDPADHMILLQILGLRSGACAVDQERTERFPEISRQWARSRHEADRIAQIVREAPSIFPSLQPEAVLA